MAAAAFSPARFTAFLAVLATFFAVGIEKAHAEDACGELITLDVRDGVTQSYALIHAHTSNPTRGVIVLMAGGGGNLALDSRGCVQQLGGNTLIRIAPHLSREGYATALVDAPSDHKGLDGLGAFRTSPEHAGDIGHVIRDLRERLDVPVHIAGSSRGTISAVNAAARLFGAEDPESVMLFSPITSGRTGGQKPWVAQTVFNVLLNDIRTPVLVVAHKDDKCARTPPGKAPEILDDTMGEREQFVLLEGGKPNAPDISPLKACAGRFPHGFGGLDREVTELIVKFLEDRR